MQSEAQIEGGLCIFRVRQRPVILQSGGMKGVRAVALLEGKGESRDQVMSDKIST